MASVPTSEDGAPTIAANASGNQWDVARRAYAFTISEAEGLAALLYDHKHKAEIDAQDAEEQRLFDEMYRLHGGG